MHVERAVFIIINGHIIWRHNRQIFKPMVWCLTNFGPQLKADDQKVNNWIFYVNFYIARIIP